MILFLKPLDLCKILMQLREVKWNPPADNFIKLGILWFLWCVYKSECRVISNLSWLLGKQATKHIICETDSLSALSLINEDWMARSGASMDGWSQDMGYLPTSTSFCHSSGCIRVLSG